MDKKNQNILVIIPAFNEQESIDLVVKDIPADIADEVVVVNNCSTDNTEFRAKAAGATVLREDRRGYGFACLKGIKYAENKTPQPDIIVFLDGDFSDYPSQMDRIVSPIIHEGYDMVIGSRARGIREKGSMTIPQIFGNKVASVLLGLIYGVKTTDLGPFRGIRFDSLKVLNMQDKTYGWTVEMQVKAAKQKMKVLEVPVDYKKRIGFSKISGTFTGAFKAGYKILYTIFKYS